MYVAFASVCESGKGPSPDTLYRCCLEMEPSMAKWLHTCILLKRLYYYKVVSEILMAKATIAVVGLHGEIQCNSTTGHLDNVPCAATAGEFVFCCLQLHHLTIILAHCMTYKIE